MHWQLIRKRIFRELAGIRAPFGKLISIAALLGLILTPVVISLNKYTLIRETPPQESNQYVPPNGTEDWITYANISWRYFQPGVGVSALTGLSYGNVYWHMLTDWDLAGYIIAILDAERLGIVSREGEWGSDFRIGKVLDFLANRPVRSDGVPYLVYKSDTGGVEGDPGPTNPSDGGRMLVALHLLNKSRPALSETINYIVYQKHNYSAIASNAGAWGNTNLYYGYYAAMGFKFFGLDSYEPVKEALEAMERLKDGEKTGDVIDIYGVRLPRTGTITEPLVLGVLELKDDVGPVFREYAERVYAAQRARFAETGSYTAWSEGGYDGYEKLDESGNPDGGICAYYVYEWIYLGISWVIEGRSGWNVNLTPVVYSKIGFAFHAIWESSYSESLLTWLLANPHIISDNGVMEGMTELGRPLIGPDACYPLNPYYLSFTDKTNSMVISAARYAVENPQYTLRDFPRPFVLENGTIRAAAVVGSNDFHGPASPASVIDFTSSLKVAVILGRASTNGTLGGYIDWEVSDFNETHVWGVRLQNNIMSFGGFGVNLVSRYYNFLKRANGSLALSATLVVDETGVYIYLPSSGNKYYMEGSYGIGQRVVDYSLLVLYYDFPYDRYILIFAGFSGYATRYSSDFIATHIEGGLSGLAMVIRLVDAEGNGIIDEATVIEVVEPST